MTGGCKVQARKALKIRDLCRKRLLDAVDAGTLIGKRGHDKAHFLIACIEEAGVAYGRADAGRCDSAAWPFRSALEFVRMANRSDRARKRLEAGG